jgi:transposase-like protein
VEVLGKKEKHRCSRYKSNRIEQDHRRIQFPVQPSLGFQKIDNARRVLIGIE